MTPDCPLDRGARSGSSRPRPQAVTVTLRTAARHAREAVGTPAVPRRSRTGRRAHLHRERGSGSERRGRVPGSRRCPLQLTEAARVRSRVPGAPMSNPLRNTTLPETAPAVTTPAYPRSELTPGVVHIGVGGFHRAHQGLYFDELAQRGEMGWGV